MRIHSRKIFTVLLCAFCVFLLACGEQITSNKNSAEKTPAPEEEKLSPYEKHIEALKTADFDYIYTLKRKDGEIFDSEDKKFVKAKTHTANRRELSDDEKTIFIGTNYKMKEADLKALKEKYEFEDFSKPEEEIKKKEETNTNSASNENGKKES